MNNFKHIQNWFVIALENICLQIHELCSWYREHKKKLLNFRRFKYVHKFTISWTFVDEYVNGFFVRIFSQNCQNWTQLHEFKFWK